MRDSPAESLVRELQTRLRGKVEWPSNGVLPSRSDFGGIVRRRPQAVITATCEDDVRRVLSAANSLRIPVQIRGVAHSCNGQTLTEGGILVINASRSPASPRWLADERVEVSGRDRWQSVERVLNGRGRSIPVLTDYLPLTVGGTLSVGGYGADSIVHGAQVDLVERLRLVKPDGEAIWCSATENPELFRFSLAGLGQVGVIERVVLRTVPYRKLTTLFVYRHESLVDLARSLAWLANAGDAGPDLFKAFCSRGRCLSVYGAYSDTVAAAMAARPPTTVDGRFVRRLVCPRYRWLRNLTVWLWVARFGHCRRMWSDYMLDHQGLAAFAERVSDLVADDAFAGCLKSIYILGVRRGNEAPELAFEAASGNRSPVQFLIGLYTMIGRRDQPALNQVRQALGSCLETAVESGGRPYLYGWHRFDGQTLRRLYGTDLDRLLEIRDELDPDALFQRKKLLVD